jgi:transcriptional regulator GlxA family with amidase domain
MNLPQKKEFDYLPGESVIVPAGETMVIDFPEANLYNPTQCIALAIDEKKIADLLHHLNDKFPKVERNDTWQIDEKYFHLKNNWEIKENIDRIVNIIRSGNILKDMLAEVTLKELLIRIMQTQARNFIFENYQKLHTNHRMAYVIQYIKDNIHQNLSIDDLSKQACMSKSHFFRSFKQEFGISPIDYILQERIERAKFLLKNSAQSIAQISYEVGFSSPAYFNRMFKKITNETPQHYKKK